MAKNLSQPCLCSPGACNADALVTGDDVIVWSDEYTASMVISLLMVLQPEMAVSLKHYKDNLQAGSVSATGGVENGIWLLDPRNVLIDNADANGAFDGLVPNTFEPTGDNATVNVATINTTLSAGTNVIIMTEENPAAGGQAGNITFAAGANILMSDGGATRTATLKFAAAGVFNNSGATIKAAGDETLNVEIGAAGTATIGAEITPGGSVLIRGSDGRNVVETLELLASMLKLIQEETPLGGLIDIGAMETLILIPP